jgi:hypothetical protein
MPRVTFELSTPVLERAKRLDALFQHKCLIVLVTETNLQCNS